MERVISYALEDSDIKIPIRKKDGYLSASRLCEAGGTEWHAYTRSNKNKAFLKHLQAKYPDQKLVESNIGNAEYRGTWVHPRVAIHLAQWISSKFAVDVIDWVIEWSAQSKQNCSKLMYELSHLEPDEGVDKAEREVQMKLKEELGAMSEVQTHFCMYMQKTGYIDLLTDIELIEIKEAALWKHALGQVLAYGEHYPEHRRVIYLFGDDDTIDIKLVRATYAKHGVELRMADMA
jgi:hypothetical protein